MLRVIVHQHKGSELSESIAESFDLSDNIQLLLLNQLAHKDGALLISILNKHCLLNLLNLEYRSIQELILADHLHSFPVYYLDNAGLQTNHHQIRAA